MTPTDEARAALLRLRDRSFDIAHWEKAEAALIAAVRADQLAVCGQWHRESEQELAALREASTYMLRHHDHLVSVPGGQPLDCAEATRLRAALAATPAEAER